MLINNKTREEIAFPFIRFSKYSDILTVNFIAKNGKNFFEEEKDDDKYYIYVDVYNPCGYNKFYEYIKQIKEWISSRSDNENSLYITDHPTMQICVTKNNKISNSKKLEEIKLAFMHAINYYTFSFASYNNIENDTVISGTFKEMQDVHLITSKAKFQNVPDKKRYLGLFLWDLKNIHNIGLNVFYKIIEEICKDNIGIDKIVEDKINTGTIPVDLKDDFIYFIKLFKKEDQEDGNDDDCIYKWTYNTLARDYKVTDESIMKMLIVPYGKIKST